MLIGQDAVLYRGLVAREYLRSERVGPAFIHDLKAEWRDFVVD